MRKALIRMATVMALVLTGPALLAAGSGRAVVVVTEDGGIGAASARTARSLLGDELRRLGVEVVENEQLAELRPLDDNLKQVVAQAGASRVYLLRLAALGQKLIVKVEQRDAGLQLLASRQLPAASAEELDVVIPRVAEALVKNLALEQTARIDNISAQEGRKWAKLPGEFLWGFGVMLGGGLSSQGNFDYGLDFRFGYEMKHFRLDFELGGIANFDEDDGLFRTGVGASYLPLTGSWSPYIGLSLDYLYLDVGGRDRGGVAAAVHAGLEFFRLHSARLLVGLDLLIPFFQLYDGNSDSYVYNLALTGNLTVLW